LTIICLVLRIRVVARRRSPRFCSWLDDLSTALVVLAKWITVAVDATETCSPSTGVLGILLAHAGGLAFMSQTSHDGASCRMAVGTCLCHRRASAGVDALPVTSKPTHCSQRLATNMAVRERHLIEADGDDTS
jgi:hypothetical protein